MKAKANRQKGVPTGKPGMYGRHKKSKFPPVDEIGFSERDVVAAQRGDTKAWHRILRFFSPEIKRQTYKHRPGFTAQDYLDKKETLEASLLEAVMKFDFRF